MGKRPTGRCALCEQSRFLRDSHLIAAGFSRHLQNPNEDGKNPRRLENSECIREVRDVPELIFLGRCGFLLSGSFRVIALLLCLYARHRVANVGLQSSGTIGAKLPESGATAQRRQTAVILPN